MLVSGLSVSMRSSNGSIGSPFHSSHDSHGRSPLPSSASRSPCHSSGRRHSFTQSASQLQAVHSSSPQAVHSQAVHSFTQSAPSISPSSLGMSKLGNVSPSSLAHTYPPTNGEDMSKLGNGEVPRREGGADGRDDPPEHRDQRYACMHACGRVGVHACGRAHMHTCTHAWVHGCMGDGPFRVPRPTVTVTVTVSNGHENAYVHACTRACASMHTRAPMHAQASMHPCMCIYLHVHIPACIYLHAYTCMCIYLHAYTYMRIGTATRPTAESASTATSTVKQ